MKAVLQMCNVRDFLKADFEGTHKRVKEIGYDYIEAAGYYDKTAKEYRNILDSCSLKCVSVHQVADVFLNNGENELNYLRTLGTEFAAIPWYDIKMYRSDFEGAIEKYKKIGKVLNENSIKLLYHNHGFDFEKLDNEYIIDRIFKEVPSELMNPQLDLCWVHYMGHNPVEYINKYSGRIKTIHLKDFRCKNLPQKPLYATGMRELIKPTTEENGFEFCPLGQGIQNVPEILAAAKQAGVEWVIAEQDFPTADSLTDAQTSLNYLRKLGVE